MNGFKIPTNEEIDLRQFDGSLQRLLNLNLGEYAVCEFLVGTNVTTTKSGYLYTVGAKYLVLYDAQNARYQVCDIFALKFITFPDQTPPAAQS